MFKYLKSGFYATSLALSLGLATTAVVTPATAYAESQMMKVYTKFTDDELVQILKKEFPNTKILKSGLIKVSFDNMIKALLIDNSHENGSLRISTYFPEQWSLRQVNDWNLSKRYITAFIEDDGDIFFQRDISVEEGVTEGTILNEVGRMTVISYLIMAMEKDKK